MGFEARIGVGDTIVATTTVGGQQNVSLYLETADGDLGEVVAEWRGTGVERNFGDGALAEGSVHATAYLRARAAGAFDRREQAFAEAADLLGEQVLKEMRGDLASRHRPWQESEDIRFVLSSATAAAARLIHLEGGLLAQAPRGIRHDAEEHLAAVGVAAEATRLAGPAAARSAIDGRSAQLTATAGGRVEIRVGGLTILAGPDGTFHSEGDEPVYLAEDSIAQAVRAHLDARPEDVAAAAYRSMVMRLREIGRSAAELEARAEVLHEERDGIALQLAGMLGAGELEPEPDRPSDDLGPAPRF